MIRIWNRAYQTRPPLVEVVGVVMDQEAPGFWQAIHVAFPVYRGPGRKSLSIRGINRVPLAVRLGPGGVVEDTVLGEATLSRVERLFGVQSSR